MNANETGIRELLEAQGRSEDGHERMVGSLLRAGEIIGRLHQLSDRQIGQLVFDVVMDEVELVSPAMPICIEAYERLFRSLAAGRPPEQVFNHLDSLPECPRCHSPMLRYVGIGEPDYRKCTALDCELKVSDSSEGKAKG